MHEITSIRLHRRDVLMAGSAPLAMLTSGCKPKSSEDPKPASQRRDVPLRILMVGSDADAEVLRRAWSSVMSQPLKVETVEISRGSADLSQLPERAKKSDLLIYPLLGVPDLVATESIVPTTAEEFEATEKQLGQVYPAARNGAAMYAGNIVALPLGAPLPALLATESVDPFAAWADYDRWVSELDGAACEPLAPGWAGAMFLWRAASTLETGWMFSREGLAPLVDSQPYIDVLTQLKQTADRYKTNRLTPSEVWNRIQAGELRGGISFQAAAKGDTQLSVMDLPGKVGANRVVLDPFSPVVSISSSCRQTGASKQFANWLSGGEGSDSLRRQIPGMTLVRKIKRAGRAADQEQAGGYEQWLRRRLEVPITLPAMQLLSAGEYYAALDRQVVRCIEGQASPEKALAEVASKWRELTESIGVEKQERAWRRAQGMRA